VEILVKVRDWKSSDGLNVRDGDERTNVVFVFGIRKMTFKDGEDLGEKLDLDVFDFGFSHLGYLLNLL
jgi:hypothetical protein